MQAAREIANTFMPRGLTSEAAEAEIERTYECFMNEEAVPEPREHAYDPETGLLKDASMLPILAEWIKQAQKADRREKQTDDI
ncbi:hypothetical protein AU375_01769 [Methylobacterium radiotolerans]|nr:hypothetical protein AU375_01769 [Methylobacterium radiotolerans]